MPKQWSLMKALLCGLALGGPLLLAKSILLSEPISSEPTYLVGQAIGGSIAAGFMFVVVVAIRNSAAK
jgi:hypothetical protein